VDQKFLQSYKATVGADFMEKEVIVDGKVINLEVCTVEADLGHRWPGEIQEFRRRIPQCCMSFAECCM
jgi:hypothetical protein